LFQDRRLKMNPVLMLVFGFAAFRSGYWLACEPFAHSETRDFFVHADFLGGDFVWGLMILGFTGFFYSVFARSVMQIPFWVCALAGIGTSLLGVFGTVYMGSVGFHPETSSDPVAEAVFGALGMVMFATPFCFVTVFGAWLGFACVELVCRRILRPAIELRAKD
jgi:uncharacterized membrane protein YdjX (TVP38/TMEM64 family)